MGAVERHEGVNSDACVAVPTRTHQSQTLQCKLPHCARLEQGLDPIGSHSLGSSDRQPGETRQVPRKISKGLIRHHRRVLAQYTEAAQLCAQLQRPARQLIAYSAIG